MSISTTHYSLQHHNGQLVLEWKKNHKIHCVSVNFLSKAASYRRHHGGGRHQLIARAIGLKGNYSPKVIDCTAGLGEDAFVLACLGCQVTMVERSTTIAALLADGLKRAKQDPSCHDLLLELIVADSIVYLNSLTEENYPDVIYLDPMFPHRKKSALAKKEMRILREIVGENEDAATLLKIALQKAKKRVVVKRPRLAPALDGPPPQFAVKGQSSRFDVYIVITVEFSAFS